MSDDNWPRPLAGREEGGHLEYTRKQGRGKDVREEGREREREEGERGENKRYRGKGREVGWKGGEGGRKRMTSYLQVLVIAIIP